MEAAATLIIILDWVLGILPEYLFQFYKNAKAFPRLQIVWLKNIDYVSQNRVSLTCSTVRVDRVLMFNKYRYAGCQISRFTIQ